MPTIKLNSITMYYETHGKGRPLVLIGGFGIDHTTWATVLEKFKQHYQVILLDNRGAGQTDIPQGRYSICEMADDVAQLCAELNIEKADFIGNSMGGCIVQALIHQHRHLIKSAVISNSMLKVHSNFSLYLSAQLEFIKAQVPLPALLQAACAWVYSFQFLNQPGVLNELIRLSLDNPFPFTVTGYQGQMAALDDFDSTSWINKINVPTLVIGSDQDLIFNQASTKYLADQIPNAKYFCFKECGHLPFIEYP